ncbi:MAG TPA: hypothetical protein VEI97_04835, partial [bacterium]|nr:hypothetical protein [bacterium]
MEVATPSPVGDGEYPVALWRGLTVPEEPQTFTVTPQFPAQPDTAVLEGFQRRYLVTAKAPWATPVESAVYVRSGQAAQVRVRYDAAKLKAPGLYVADIELREEGLPRGLAPDAILRSIVVVPHRFDPAKGYRAAWTDRTVGPSWRVDRHFLYVPPYASAVRFTLEAPEPRAYPIRVRSLFTQDGGGIATPLELEARQPLDRSTWTWARDLEPGVVEIPVVDPQGETGGRYSLRAELVAVTAHPTTLTAGAGDSPAVKVDVHNLLEVPYRATGTATIDSHLSHHTAKFGGEDRTTVWKHTIPLDNRHSGVRVTVTFDREDYLAFTDVPFGLYRSDGTAAARDGLSERSGSV